MEPRRFIRSGIAASAIGHLSVLTTILVLAEVHPFGSVTAEPITVDIVSPEDAPPAPKTEAPPPEPTTKPSDVFDLSQKSAPSSSAPAPAAPQQAAAPQQNEARPQAAAKQQAAAEQQAPAAPQQQAPAAAQQQAPAAPQPQAELSTPATDAQPTSPQPQFQPQPQPQPPPASTSPGFAPPEPDLSVKYHVMLGLPPDLSTNSQGKGDYNFDSPAAKTADVASGIVAEFRQRVRSCAKLPASVAPSDKIRIKLRVLMTPEGRLAAEPILIEASASAKGPALMQGAISALQACQPYAMLPADRYGEWKVIDLSFTPEDFGGAS